jgi:hypothetical protein
VENIERGLVIKWVKRLQDPKSKQAYGRLRDNEGGMCCLGHLCHVYAPRLWRKDPPGGWVYLGSKNLLPEKLKRLTGLDSYGSPPDDAMYRIPGKGEARTLVSANDAKRCSLPEIADAVIKKYGITPEELA